MISFGLQIFLAKAVLDGEIMLGYIKCKRLARFLQRAIKRGSKLCLKQALIFYLIAELLWFYSVCLF